MIARHLYLHSQELVSSRGRIKLDEQGIVTNPQDIEGGHDGLIDFYPETFLDTRAFPPLYAKAEPRKATEARPTETISEIPSPTDADYSQLIQDLMEQANCPINSEGYIEMPYLNEAIKARGWRSITGTRRKELQMQAPASSTIEDSLPTTTK